VVRRSSTLLLVALAMTVAAPADAAASGETFASRLLRSPAGRVESFAGFKLARIVTEGGVVRFQFGIEPGEAAGANLVEVSLHRRDDAASPLARTRSFDASYLGPLSHGRPAPRFRQLVDELVAVIDRNDEGGLIIPPGREEERFDGASGEPWSGEGSPGPTVVLVDRAMAGVGIGLVCLFLVLLPFTGRRWTRDLRDGLAGGGRTLAVAFVVACVAGLALRLVLDHRPVMYYMGYRMADMASRLEDIPKYGSGALALYHLVFLVTGTSHVAMMYANAVAGALLAPAGAWLALRVGASGAGAALAGILLSLTPVFVKDATSESLLVPTTVWTVMGLALALRFRSTRSTTDLALAAVHVVLAMFARPEAIGLIPVTLAALWWHAPRGAAPVRRAHLAVLAAAAVPLVLRVVHLRYAVGVELSRGNTPQMASMADAWGTIVEGFLARNLALWPSMFPAAVTALALGALLFRGVRWHALSLLVAASVWLAVALLDLPYVSIPRVQAPGAVFVAIAAGLGWDAVMRWVRDRTARPAALAGAWVAFVAVVASSMGATVPTLWARTNADDEEELLRDAVASLPPDPLVVLRRGYEDEPPERTHLYWPDYLFRPPFRDDVVGGLDWFVHQPFPSRPVFFIQGMRCHMRAFDAEGLHPACRRMHERYRLEPVFERSVPARDLPVDRAHRPHQDLDFPWRLSGGDEMVLGLYRVHPR
jgi:hypothetical protein